MPTDQIEIIAHHSMLKVYLIGENFLGQAFPGNVESKLTRVMQNKDRDSPVNCLDLLKGSLETDTRDSTRNRLETNYIQVSIHSKNSWCILSSLSKCLCRQDLTDSMLTKPQVLKHRTLMYLALIDWFDIQPVFSKETRNKIQKQSRIRKEE